MSTNAVIRIEGFTSGEVYKHWDGYPESTLPWLETFNKEFVSQRGKDPAYKFAALLRSSAADAEKYHLDPSRFTGWGVFPVGSSYFNYLYILKDDGTVTVVKDGEEEGNDE